MTTSAEPKRYRSYVISAEYGEYLPVNHAVKADAQRRAADGGGYAVDLATGRTLCDHRPETSARPGNGHLVRKAEQVEPAAYGCFGVLCGWAVVFATFATLAGAYLLALHYR